MFNFNPSNHDAYDSSIDPLALAYIIHYFFRLTHFRNSYPSIGAGYTISISDPSSYLTIMEDSPNSSFYYLLDRALSLYFTKPVNRLFINWTYFIIIAARLIQ